jgi:hypothetical protein
MQKVSYFEAKRIVLGASHPTTFAHVVAKRPTVTVGTQTTPENAQCICTLETKCLALTNDETSPIQPSEAQTNVATSSVRFPLPSSAKPFDQLPDTASQSLQTTVEVVLPTSQPNIKSASCKILELTPVEAPTTQPFDQKPIISPSSISTRSRTPARRSPKEGRSSSRSESNQRRKALNR